METNKGDKEVTPGQTPAETKGDSPAGVANSDNKTEAELDQRIAEKQKQLDQLSQETRNLTENLRGLREEKREFKLFDDPKPAPAKRVEGEEDYEDNDDVSIDQKVEQKLMERTQQERVRMYNATAERFIREHDEFDPNNDVGGELLREFKVRATNTFLGETENQVHDTLKFILAGIRGMQPQEKNEEDITDIGEIKSTPVEKDKETEDWNTKSLNKWEKIAAKNYPGGESAYRKARAEIAKKK